MWGGAGGVSHGPPTSQDVGTGGLSRVPDRQRGGTGSTLDPLQVGKQPTPVWGGVVSGLGLLHLKLIVELKSWYNWKYREYSL